MTEESEYMEMDDREATPPESTKSPDELAGDNPGESVPEGGGGAPGSATGGATAGDAGAGDAGGGGASQGGGTGNAGAGEGGGATGGTTSAN